MVKSLKLYWIEVFTAASGPATELSTDEVESVVVSTEACDKESTEEFVAAELLTEESTEELSESCDEASWSNLVIKLSESKAGPVVSTGVLWGVAGTMGELFIDVTSSLTINKWVFIVSLVFNLSKSKFLFNFCVNLKIICIQKIGQSV